MSTDDALASAQREMKLKIRLTPAWTPLIPHRGQSLYFWSPVRFKINPSGRRSGKTENAKRKGPRLSLQRRKFPPRMLYGAPTEGQARDIFWQDLQNLIPEHWVAYKNQTRMEIITCWGAMFRIFGFDRPRRAEGVIWDWICLDEFSDCPRNAFKLNIRPALSTVGREGSADFIGVPDEVGRNQAEYEELWETGLRWDPSLIGMSEAQLDELKADPDICSFHWPSTDIISPKEALSAKRGMDDLAFRQEYGGEFVSSGGKALPRFDVKVHVSEDMTSYSPYLPLDWSLDFGTRKIAHLIGQTYKNHVWIMDEIALEGSSTDVAAEEFLINCQSRGWSLRRVRGFGDAAGNTAGSNVGKSDYEIIEEKLGNLNIDWCVPTHNPMVKDTLNAVRSTTCTADGIVHLHIHPRCQNLINDCKTAPWPDGSNKLRDYHWLAALRYYCYGIFNSAGQMSVAARDVARL